jgi:hypothetical protein
MRAAFDAHKVDLDREEEQVHRQASLVNSLRIAAEKYGGTGDALPAAAQVDPEKIWWTTAARTKAIVRALEMLGHPVGPTTITDFLRNHGRSDTPAAVSATLNYLAGQDQVSSMGYGKWVAAMMRPDPVTQAIAEETRRREFGPPALPPERGATS